jgi:hypothetical protein
MPRVKSITSLMVTAVFAACGGGDTAADHEAMGEAEMAAAPASTSEVGCFLQGATMEETADRPSPLQTTTFSVGETGGLVCYGAPSANERGIMGGLVPYGELWRSGANEATAIHLDGPATVGGISLAAGSYSLYTLPSDGDWEVFLNSNFERWGIPISDEVRTTDVGSFTVTPEATDAMVETLTYSYEATDASSGDLLLEWENTRIRIPISAGM